MKSLELFKLDIEKYGLNYKSENLRLDYSYANGCGAKGGIPFPPTMWFVNIESACIIHDIEWQLAQNYQELLDANENFDNNLKLITDYESLNDATRWIRRMRISKYVTGVELKGTDSYALERGFI